MNPPIGYFDTRREYVSIATARQLSGLRLVLGAYAIPGPWRESCKALFHVKGLTWTAARSADQPENELGLGADGAQSELMAWTAQASAPVAIWNDERPRALWNDQLNLAERLNPEPPLVPEDFDDRVRMFGLINEIAGENGLGWTKRVLMCEAPLKTLAADDPDRAFWLTLADKYGYTRARAEAAVKRIVGILGGLDQQLRQTQAGGSRFMLGERLSALDLYWACFCGLLDPLPEEQCPMSTDYRPAYSPGHPAIDTALTAALRAHRDFIYAEYLELPIVF